MGRPSPSNQNDLAVLNMQALIGVRGAAVGKARRGVGNEAAPSREFEVPQVVITDMVIRFTALSRLRDRYCGWWRDCG